LHAFRPVDRRTFLADLGRGSFALAVLALTGCAPGSGSTPSSSANAAGPSRSPTPGASGGGPPGSSPDGDLAWQRVDLGFVSAYLLVRGGEAALVDTGVGGSADAIEASLGAAGLGWPAVGHVILSHRHDDHVGSLVEVMRRAPDAAAYCGHGDLEAILSERPVTAVGDGDDVFGLQVVETPGHTAGSISVLDPAAGVLVAGDAMGTAEGRPTLPGSRFTIDMEGAKASVVKLGALAFETLLVGHGDPIEAGASTLVAELGTQG
jgi:glyoxylase-like metal-dependent hydrolase (beta-lactamase superfamily II)